MNKNGSFETIELLIPAILLLAMLFIICTQVILRSIFDNPLSWPEEVTRWCLIWITFGGASYGLKTGAFISVDFFMKKFFPDLFSYIEFINIIISLIFFMLSTVSGYLFTLSTIKHGTLMPVTKVPIAISNISIFIGFFICTIRSLQSMIDTYRSIGKEGED